jgi:hypothetical protein
MWLEAIVTKEDVLDLATRLSPLEIRLGSDGSLLLSRPSEVAFVPDHGIQVACDARLHWPFLGMKVPVTMRGLTFLVRPAVEERHGGYALVFRLGLERAGFTEFGLLDEKVTALLDAELEKRHLELGWNFSRTLTHNFSMPDTLLSVEHIGLRVQLGRAKITSEALGLAVSMGTSVGRRGNGSRERA